MDYYKNYRPLKKTLKLCLEYQEILTSRGLDIGHEENNEITEIVMRYENDIKDSFNSEYLLYSDNQYFFGCIFEVYKETYKERLTEFKNTFFDTDEIDFIEEELNEGLFTHKFKTFTGVFFESFQIQIEANIEKQISYSLKKRFEYLKQRAAENNLILTYNAFDGYNLETIKKPLEPTKEDVLIDYSNSTPPQKIIALNELGIIKYLRQTEPFKGNITSLGQVISLFTGLNAANVRSSITPMLNEYNVQRNNPYKNDKNVKQIRKKLIEIKN